MFSKQKPDSPSYQQGPGGWERFRNQPSDDAESICPVENALDKANILENLPAADTIHDSHQQQKVELGFDQFTNKLGKCIFCGEITGNWWWHNGQTGECKCRRCRDEKGLF